MKLEASISSSRQALVERRRQRADLLTIARGRLSPELSRQLDLWADYLEMKAETNETHCLYRGRVFTWFGVIGYRPST